MIKLVASDIDGTLVPEGTNQLNEDIYHVVRKMQEKGILFAVASGRHYSSMRFLFDTVWKDIIFVTENGSCVLQNGETVSVTYIAPDAARALLEQLRTYEGAEIILSTPEKIYTESKNREFRKRLEDLHIRVEAVPDLLPYCCKTNKIAVYQEAGTQEMEKELQEMLGSTLNIVRAGAFWIDCMDRGADKGIALQRIQQKWNIAREETMAFGDNCNDIGMIKQAGESYAVANAHPALKEAAKYEALSFKEDGVLQVLENLLSGSGTDK